MAADADFSVTDDPTTAGTYYEPRSPNDGLYPYLKWLFASFKGRVRRRELWLGSIAISITAGLLGAFADNLAGMPAVDANRVAEGGFSIWQSIIPPDTPVWLIVFNGLVSTAFFVLGIPLQAKRLHDRGRSAKWLYFFLGVPIASICVLLAIEAMTGVDPSIPIEENDPLFGIYSTAIWITPINVIILLWWFVDVWIAPSKVGPNRWGPQVVPKPPTYRHPGGPAPTTPDAKL